MDQNKSNNYFLLFFIKLRPQQLQTILITVNIFVIQKNISRQRVHKNRHCNDILYDAYITVMWKYSQDFRETVLESQPHPPSRKVSSVISAFWLLRMLIYTHPCPHTHTLYVQIYHPLSVFVYAYARKYVLD